MSISTHNIKELTQIGHYEIIDCIGRGGMGLVYLARDPRLDRQVAIKCLRAELYEQTYRERFKREALLLAKLNHPHIVQIYDFIESPEQLALVMEYVDGQNLQVQLREQIVSSMQRMQWLTQIAQGLAVAHDSGIIHRDLKAENILINKRNYAKISDLGIAKSQDFNVTLTEHVTGSYCSMSPEQAMGEELNFKSDLFSFGILAYQMLCGAHPFGDTNNKLQLMQRIISHPPTPPGKYNPNLPPEICNLLGQLLSKNPDNRPDNTHWVANQFEQLSKLVLHTQFEHDETPPLPAQLNKTKSNKEKSGIQKNLTQEHPTFDTGFNTPVSRKPLHNFFQKNKFGLLLIATSLLMLAGVGVWQIRPVQPHYVAVLPAIFTAEGMQESQQELVKDAIYDATQQSIIQLNGYYLIPRDEIADINADNTKEGIETIRRATAADELITTTIKCKIDACTITLARLIPDSSDTNSRLRVQETKTIDVLTDNYLSVATIVQNTVGSLYAKKIANTFEKINDAEYAKFLELNRNYLERGAGLPLLTAIDGLQKQTKTLPAVQNLYTDIALDLHYETKDPRFLQKLEENIESNSNQNQSKESLYNKYYLQIAQKNFDGADKTTEKLQQLNASNSAINELHGYTMLAKKDYQSAIAFYKKSLETKPTAKNLYYLSMAYWYAADTASAKNSLREALHLSPTLYKAQSLYGSIELLDGNIEQAMASFKQMAAQKPDDTYTISHLGLCYLLLKDYNEASKLFDSAIKLAPQNTYFKLNKADSENLKGNISESNKLYQGIIDSINIENISNEELSSVAQAYAHLGKFSEALTKLQQLEKLDPQNIETTFTAALVHTLANNNSSAVLNISNTLKNGMNKIWFSFSWFNSLCQEENFVSLMKNYGEPNRCAPR